MRSLRMNFRFTAASVVATLLATASTWEVGAQETTAAPVAIEHKPVVRRITICAADVNGLPTCASFFETSRRRVGGDAAPFYYRALSEADSVVGSLAEWEARRPRRDSTIASDDRVEKLQAWLDELPPAALRELEAGARMERCDFDWRLEDRPAIERLTFPLDELAGLRALSAAVVAQAEIEVAHGRFDEALSRLRVATALSRHVAQAPTIVAHLLATAQSQQALDVVELWIAAPGSPNLHWALRELACSPCDRCRMIAMERGTVEDLFPALFEAERIERSPAQWQAVFSDTARTMAELSSEKSAGAKTSNEPAKIDYDQVAVAMVTATCDPAKQSLRADGFDAREVEAMPPERVVAIFAARTGKRELDAVLHPLLLPSHEALAATRRMEETLAAGAAARGERVFVVPAGRMLAQATAACVRATLKFDRRVAALAALEAVRDHMAATDGELPDDLKELAGVAAPLDPQSLEPFDWMSDGETGALTLDWPVPAEAALPTVVYEIGKQR